MNFDWDDEQPAHSTADLARRADAMATRLTKAGETLHPVSAAGRNPAKSFWGKAWCRHIEGFHDYASRLPRGRSYLKNRQVIDLVIDYGEIRARVMGENLYTVHIHIVPVTPERLDEVKRSCAGGIDSLIALLRGELSEGVIACLCDPDHGLFPGLDEIRLDCDCPDWADLCKHLAAVLYGIGARLDVDPALFYKLRAVHPAALYTGALPAADLAGDAAGDLSAADIADIFEIEL